MTYLPGKFPDNVTSIKVGQPVRAHDDARQGVCSDVLHRQRAIPDDAIPQHAWDKTSASGKVGNYDQTPAGAKAVMSFLQTQSKDLKTYATNPLWKTVDGPFKLTGYTQNGKATFTPNKSYSGPDKPKISAFVEVPFTSADAEYNALRAGDLTIGYIPANDYSTIPEIKQLGYNVAQWKVYGYQLPVHQLQQPDGRRRIPSAVHPAGTAVPARSAAADIEGLLRVRPARLRHGRERAGRPGVPAEHDAYPYNPAKAKALLAAHGWNVKPGGTTTCARPGTGANQCGPGIKAGFPLNFNLLIYSGAAAAADRHDLLQDGRGDGRDRSSSWSTTSTCSPPRRLCKPSEA